jgi:hypothetical protein
MIWLNRRFAYDEYEPYLEVLKKLASDNPHEDFAMASTRLGDPHLNEYFVGLPDASMSANFRDFETIDEERLPMKFDAIVLGDPVKVRRLAA